MSNYGYGDLSGMFGDRYSTQAALNDTMLKEAMSIGQLDRTRYAPMSASTYFQAAGGGTPLGSMLTQAHPTMQRQNILAELQKKHSNPDTPEKLMALAADLSTHGFGDMAMKVRQAANDMPERKTIKGGDGFNYYVDTGERVLPGVQTSEKYTIKEIKTQDADGNPLTETWQVNSQGQLVNHITSAPTHKPEGEKYTTTEVKTMVDGKRVTETWQVNSKGELVNKLGWAFTDKPDKPEERTFTKAADDYHYYDDDGSRVFPNVEKDETQSSLEQQIELWANADEETRKMWTEAGIFGANTTSIILNAGEEAYGKELGGILAKADRDLVTGVDLAMSSVIKTNKVLTLLNDEGVTTGIAAELSTALDRGWHLIQESLGFTPTDKDEVSKEQYLEALLGSDVFPLIKQLGIGARGLDTPAEREFLLQVMTGSRKMDRGALQRITRLRQEISREIIDKYNQALESGNLDKYQKVSEITLKPQIPDEMVKIIYKRPDNAGTLKYNGQDTGFFTWDGKYFTKDNEEISMEEINTILAEQGFFEVEE